MSRHLFLLLCFSFLVISFPENYRAFFTHTGTNLLSSLFATSSANQGSPHSNEAWQSWTNDAEEELRDVIDYSARVIREKYASIVAQVSFQTSTPWTHVIWIDKGSKTPDLPFQLRQNAPVLVGSTLVGIVDFVGAHSSRIRLISDPSIHPAARVVRGGYMPRQAIFMARELQKMVQKNPSMMANEALAQKLSALLDILVENTQQETSLRLAKGELQGCESPSNPFILRGIGFNYNSSDDEGPKRDLRSGQSEGGNDQIPLIKPGDILETSGLDGLFPKGLELAVVTKVFPLEEGAISYTILAKSLAPDFSGMEYVTIIPALGQEPFHPQTKEEKILALIHSTAEESKSNS